MPNYRRTIISGGEFFFMVVTFDRTPILTTELSPQILRHVWNLEELFKNHLQLCRGFFIIDVSDHGHVLQSFQG